MGPDEAKSSAVWQRKIGFEGDDANGVPGKTGWDEQQVPNV